MRSVVTTDESKARLYLRTREEFRDRTAASFASNRPDAVRVMSAANELIAESCLFVSGKDFSQIPAGEYLSGLLVSFCRSHFLLADLIRHGELVEAGVILRKQMELVSRLHELRSGGDIEAFIGKTPNVRHLQGYLRRMYGEYSEIAHSSHPRSLMLLGRITKDERSHTAFYPVFDQNAYVAVIHMCFLILEFHLWTSEFYEDCFLDDKVPNESVRDFWLLFLEFTASQGNAANSTEDASRAPPAAGSSIPSRFVLAPCWASEGVSGRAVLLALAALFELQRTNAAVDAQGRMAAEAHDIEARSEATVEQLNSLAVALAYQHAIGCINFVGSSTQDELTGKQTVDDAFRDWLKRIGVTRSLEELEARAVKELQRIDVEYERQSSG